jgi:hypothetical protein
MVADPNRSSPDGSFTAETSPGWRERREGGQIAGVL